MPMEHEHDPYQYLRALFRPIFLKVFLEKDCNVREICIEVSFLPEKHA